MADFVDDCGRNRERTVDKNRWDELCKRLPKDPVTFMDYCNNVLGMKREEAQRILEVNSSGGDINFEKSYLGALMKRKKDRGGVDEELESALRGAELAEVPGPEDEDLPYPFEIDPQCTEASSQNPEGSGGQDEDNKVEPDKTGRFTQEMKPAKPSSVELNDKKTYQMNANPKGLLFLMNIKESRTGSEVDFDNIKHVFKQIGYEIEPHIDLTSKELEKNLETFVNQERHKDMCSVVFVLMGHGIKSGIQCFDGEIVSTKFVKDTVYQMDSMCGKPKMIFYQTCRKEEQNSGMGKTTDGGDDDDDDDEDDDDDDDDAPLNLENESDVLLAYATTEGRLAKRNHTMGSRFISSLCKILLERAHKDDLCSMLDQVTEGVKNKRKKKIRQNPVVIKQGISKKIFFLPKYPPQNDCP